MKRYYFVLMTVMGGLLTCYTSCTEKGDSATAATNNNEFGGYESQEAWGKQLVTVMGCNDCHTPKKMSPMGPVLDSSLLLSGHPAQMPPPDVDRKEMESKGLAVTNTMTAWVGPWGISYSANLTSDETGIGNWEESAFIIAMKEGKFKGMANGRSLLPPMPWQGYAHLSDDELKAIFAYLKSTKPVSNVVPVPVPPVLPPPVTTK